MLRSCTLTGEVGFIVVPSTVDQQCQRYAAPVLFINRFRNGSAYTNFQFERPAVGPGIRTAWWTWPSVQLLHYVCDCEWYGPISVRGNHQSRSERTSRWCRRELRQLASSRRGLISGSVVGVRAPLKKCHITPPTAWSAHPVMSPSTMGHHAPPAHPADNLSARIAGGPEAVFSRRLALILRNR